MKTVVLVFAAILCMSLTRGQEIVVQKLQGDVSVRHGVEEVWTKVSVGDVLRPDDTMKTGRRGSAILVAASSKRIMLPAEVIVDMSDIRELSQEELMLKLTMERVRSSSYEWKSKELNIPNVTTVHGTNRSASNVLSENDLEVGKFQLNGTRVLFDNGFYSTCALKAMDVLRHHPLLGADFDGRFLIAQALEKANLRGEALNEYVLLSKSDNLTSGQSEKVQIRIRQLRKQFEQ